MSTDPKNMSDQELLDMIKKAFDALDDIESMKHEQRRLVTHSRREYFDEEECKMCGKDKPLNYEGYCSTCWQVWKS